MKTINTEKKAPLFIGLFIGLIIISYAVNRSHDYLVGPTIIIDTPSNGETLNKVLLNISGKAERVAFITLNDRQIFIDQDGQISEQLLLQDGYNIISIKATDRFGRKVEKRLELTYKQTTNN